MRQKTDALIIRENNNVGESDRFVTALTRDFGVLRASARGARQVKSPRAAATQLLAYSRLTLYRGKSGYIIDSAQPLRVFFELRSSLETTALAQYFCELAGVLCPREEPAADGLRLLLNALHLLGAGTYPAAQVKAVTELRLLAQAGFMPDCTACSGCGRTEDERLWFYPQQGVMRCGACHAVSPEGPAMPLPAGALSAMRYCLQVPLQKCFFFTLKADALASLAKCSEALLLAQTGRGFTTLDFYRTLDTPPVL